MFQKQLLSLRVLINPGDEVILFDLVYDAYDPCIKMCEEISLHVELKQEDNFIINAETLEKAINSKTKAIILNFPNKPTGVTMSLEELEPVANLFEKYIIFILFLMKSILN